MLNKRNIMMTLIVSFLAMSVSFAQPTPRKGIPTKGVVRVKLQADIAKTLNEAKGLAKAPVMAEAGQNLQIGIKPLDYSLKQIGGMKIRKAFPCSPERAAQHKKFGLDQWYEINFDENISPLEARSILKKTAGVEMATVKVPMKLMEGNGKFKAVVDNSPARAAANMPFNDPRLSSQWHYNNDGSTVPGAVAGADINLFKAWQIETGKPNVVVAVIDGGIDYNHEDLAAHMWINEAEKNGQPGVDDDGNGFIDDVYGYNFCSRDGTIYPHNHGTHVAGTVSAVNNNGIGVCGVAGGDGTPNSGVRLMSCQVFDPRSGLEWGDFAGAIIYAADMGATIAQCSWGWDDDGYYEQDVLDAIRYFTNTARSNNMTGGLCIFASGNAGITGKVYPGCMDEVLCVAAMTCSLTPASYSNYGEWVDVIAPGGDMDFNNVEGVMSTLPNNTYGYNEGTSMATPHVSGIAALVLSKYGSSTLINESLRQQIVTSVNDFYTKNDKVVGLYGSGYVDAYKALQWGDGTAPSTVTDLEAIAMQESVTLNWTIPSSSSNNVNSHILYYSENPFTESTLSSAKTIIIDTKFNSSGDKFSYEVAGLKPTTTYYFALKAVDRWSNASELSAVVSVTTNAGPQMTISRTSMAMNCTDGKTWPTRNFDINNKGEGLLKWKANLRTASSAIRAYSNDAQKLLTVPYSGHATIQPAANEAREIIKDIENFTQEDYPRYIENYESLHAYIGDNELPNSMAQLFRVNAEEYPNGFNLTHVMLEGMYGKHPIFEIYRNAGTLSQSTRLLRYDAGEDAISYGFDHALPECIYFNPGESFYIVVHFEDYDSRNYPLGLGLSNGNTAAPQAFMSNDKGKTWSLLSEILKGTSYENVAEKATWAISAISKFPDWSEVLTLTPAEGQVKYGEKQTVTVSQDGTPLPNGNYRATIKFDTNESQKNDLSISVAMNVSGQKPNVSFNKIVEFGNLLVGQKKTITVEVFNKGYGAFAGGESYSGLFSNNISSTSKHFRGPEYMQNGIPSRSKATIDLTYEPTEAGSHAGVIILTDKDGTQLRINVTGSATDPAKIVVTPEGGINVGDLNATTGEAKTVNFTISNEGKYPLQYVMPKFSNETFDGIASSSTHRFGYVWQSNMYGSNEVEYEGKPELIDAVDISNQFGDYDYFSDPIDIGFDFPFYGKTYNKIYVSSFGTLSFAPYLEGLIYNMYPGCTYVAGLGVISVYGQEFQIAPSSRIEYAKQDGKFVVNFKDVLVTVYDTERMPASFHIALSPSGDIDIAFDDYDPAKVFQQGCNLWVGVVDPDQEDELTVTSSETTSQAFWYDDESEENNRWRHIQTGTAFKFYAPKPNMIAEVSPAASIVSPGDKVEITAKVKATDEMYAGATYTDLVIMSNDLVTPTKIVRFNANIVGELYPDFALNKENIEFGDVFRTSVATQSISVQNHGRSALNLQSVSLSSDKFTHNFTSAVEIPAGQSKDIIITMLTDTEGEQTGTLTIVTSDGTKTVQLSGKVIGVPQIELSYNSVKETLAYEENKSLPLTVKNTGNEPLKYSIIAGNHVSYTPEYSTGSKTEYQYVSSLDESSAYREWIDIETTGLGQQYNYTNFLNKDIIPVDLPFEFTYFNKEYRRMYVYDSGFVSFTSRRDEGIWPEPPGDFPAGTIYNNVIAPYWGLHTMDITNTAGIYYYVTDEMAVVSWIEYGNSMNIGVDFQLVIRKDGTFTFNYKQAFDYADIFAPFGISGISNENGEGFSLPARYIAFGSSVNFTPVVEHTINPGENQTADIKVLGDELAGHYNSKITINTNIPTTPEINIPVDLTITGAPRPVFPEDVTVEQVSEYINSNLSDELSQLGAYWYIPIEVANTGSAPFTITGIDIETPMYEGYPMFNLYWYGQYTDIWSGALVNGWNPYSGSHIKVGRGVTKFAFPLWGNDYSQIAWQTPGEYNIKLTFHISGIEDITEKVVNIVCRITDQPVMVLDKDEIRVKALEDNFVSVETVNISNKDGKYPLKYTIKVDPTGMGEKDSNSGSIVPSLNAPASNLNTELIQVEEIHPQDVGNSEFVYDTPDEETLAYYNMEYNRALYWPGREDRTTMYNYGTGTTYGTYKSAVGYVGPEGGFNISHVYFAMHPYGLSNTDVEFEIINGDPQNSTDVIGHGTFHIGEVETPLYQNNIGICALDKPVYITEGQEFYVVITYPTGQEYPASLIYKQEAVVSNRYLGYADNYGWFDVASLFQDGYGSLGYLCTCLETVDGDAWVKLLDPEDNKVSVLTGEIAAGESMDLKVRISALEAPKDKGNKAILIMKTNDPKNKLTNFPVYLDKNSAPTITIKGSNLLVNEGEQITLTVIGQDVDGDDFTFSLSSNVPFATIESVSELTDGGKQATIIIAPETGTEGSYVLTIKATDSFGHVSTESVKLTVTHTNCPPEFIPMSPLYVQTRTMSTIVDMEKLFNDPDDTQLTYDASIDNAKVAQMFRSDNSLVFAGLKQGNAIVTVTCTDPAGATATGTFRLLVRDDYSAIDNAKESLASVVVDQTNQKLVIKTADITGIVRVAIFTPSGQKVAAASYAATPDAYVMNIASLPVGNYVVCVSSATSQITKQVSKK